MQHFIAQATELAALAGPWAQMGFGGALLYVIVRWLQRIENVVSSRLEGVEHAMRGLSKAIWLDLANRADAGSFVREEAKKSIDRANVREQVEADEIARRRGVNL